MYIDIAKLKIFGLVVAAIVLTTTGVYSWNTVHADSDTAEPTAPAPVPVVQVRQQTRNTADDYTPSTTTNFVGTWQGANSFFGTLVLNANGTGVYGKQTVSWHDSGKGEIQVDIAAVYTPGYKEPTSYPLSGTMRLGDDGKTAMLDCGPNVMKMIFNKFSSGTS